MTAQARRLGLAQLCLVGTAPPDLVTIAAEARFDFIGARVRPVTAMERPYNLQPGSPMLSIDQPPFAQKGPRRAMFQSRAKVSETRGPLPTGQCQLAPLANVEWPSGR